MKLERIIKNKITVWQIQPLRSPECELPDVSEQKQVSRYMSENK